MISVVFFCLCCLVLSNVRCLREREKASMRRTCRNADSWIRVFDSFIYLVSVDFWSKSDRYFRSISFFFCSLNSRAFVYTKIKHILNFSFCLSSSTQIWLEYDCRAPNLICSMMLSPWFRGMIECVCVIKIFSDWIRKSALISIFQLNKPWTKKMSFDDIAHVKTIHDIKTNRTQSNSGYNIVSFLLYVR